MAFVLMGGLLSFTAVAAWQGELRDTCVCLPDDPAYDLRPGFAVSCRVRFDATNTASGGWTTLAMKGNIGEPGAYWLRVSKSPERPSIDFFPNVGDGPEPRVHSGIRPEPGKWYDVAAGWDGTNAWLTVNGRTTRQKRVGAGGAVAAALQVGPLTGVVTNLHFAETAAPVVPGAQAGFLFGGDVVFLKKTAGEQLIATEQDVWLLRYDRLPKAAGLNGKGYFYFYENLNGSWEPRLGIPMEVETGRVYRVVCGWDGLEAHLSVDDQAVSQSRGGRPNLTPGKVKLGTPGLIRVGRTHLRNARTPRPMVKGLHSKEFLPREGEMLTMVGEVVNCGVDASAVELTLHETHGGRVVAPTRQLESLKMFEKMPLAWQIDPGTNTCVDVVCTATIAGRCLARATKRIQLMPKDEKAFCAQLTAASVCPTRTFYVDARGGDDAHDGLSPATAWRTFRHVTGRTLGPGERLLLKRGSVFAEELVVTAAGTAANWAEIGAYGEGMRPQIRRRRMIDERCGLVVNPRYLVVHDLIFCEAGSGFCIYCDKADYGHVLVERCLAHHIEGLYRFNSHGIPEWRDRRGADAGGGRSPRSCGIGMLGAGRGLVLRDCEAYQCSNGFDVRGVDALVTRVYSHDNYAHNTSPHPFNVTSRAWMTDSVFDASGWHAAHGTMGIMLASNNGFVIRNCHFLNQPDSGSADQGGIDFETRGDNCVIEQCTFRNNAGAPIEVLGLKTPQARNVRITRCRFDRNNWAYKNGPSEISIWGTPQVDRDITCSNGLIDDNGYVLVPGVPFYHNASPTTNDWKLVGNRAFRFSEELDRAYPWGDPPAIRLGREIWTDQLTAPLDAKVAFNPAAAQAPTSTRWEQIEGPAGVRFVPGPGACAQALLPGEGDYRVNLTADDGTFWRAAHTAIHVLPKGARTFHVWNFAHNLDSEGWRAENTGAGYEHLPGDGFYNGKVHPVRLVCGDYYVIAVNQSTNACLVTPETQDVGVSFSRERANRLRVKLQNRTNATRMRLWWQTTGPVNDWAQTRSVAFDVKPNDPDDTVYEAALPAVGAIKQLKLSLTDGEAITGTCRIDYIWLGNRPNMSDR